MTLVVKIINPRLGTWYENKKGWTYEVEEVTWAGVPCYMVAETENHTWRLYLSLEDVQIVEVLTNG